MSGSDQPAQTTEEIIVNDEMPACVALVPVVSTVHWSRVPDRQLSRADFITQLIATAEHLPQTRNLRRATPADAQAAYGAQRRPLRTPGIRTRQIA